MNTETPHARARRAAVIGLILQILASLASFLLFHQSSAASLFELTWMMIGGIPIWFVLVLVFRQYELAALEQVDLEALKREKAATGGGEALFGAEGGGPGFLVAQTRLDWMRSWLVPVFSLLTALYLAGMGGFVGKQALSYQPGMREWPVPANLEITLILLTLVMILLIFFSRYASGLSRVKDWQLLRAGGTYAFGCGLVTVAIVAAFGLQLAKVHDGIEIVEHYIAYAIPVLMLLLGIETLLNFLLDFYRPRSPGQEARAAFDSRILGLFSEPGGIANSVADALHYQFGFQVSQTWFFQLLQRVAVPLIGIGALAIWLLTGVIFVQTNELGIVERFGRTLNASEPLGPGLHFKLPYPIDVIYKFDTGQLHEFVVGYKVADGGMKNAPPPKAGVPELWTDDKHAGRDHFNFMISPPRASDSAPGSQPAAVQEARTAVNMVRAHAVIQYRIRADQLADYYRSMHESYRDEPQVDKYLQQIAWNEMVRMMAAVDIDQIMGDFRTEAAIRLKRGISERLSELKLGVEIVHVGFIGIHPEKSVAEAFRTVVTAQMQRTADIRKGRVEENAILSAVAGDRDRAQALAQAVQSIRDLEARRGAAERVIAAGKAPGPDVEKQFDGLKAQFDAMIESEWKRDRTQQELASAQEDFNLGIGSTARDIRIKTEAVTAANQALDAARAALEQGLAPLRQSLTRSVGTDVAAAVVSLAEDRFRMAFWLSRLERSLVGLEGDAAVRLAQAQARRWGKELKAAAELTSVQAQRYAYAANPEVYRARRYFQVLVNGIKEARKYVLGFDPGDRPIKFLVEAAEQARQGLEDMPTKETQQ